MEKRMIERLRKIKWITFDCYGTLIDWESGIIQALKPLFERSQKPFHPDEILQTYARLESQAEQAPYRPYRAVLRDVMIHIARMYDLYLAPGEERILEEQLPEWKPFKDVPWAFSQLASLYPVAVLSNIDMDLIQRTFQHIQVFPTFILTSEQVRVYKPNLAFFKTFLSETKTQPESILHCAQSFYHDIQPASELGWVTCHVNRPHPWGAPATPHVEVEPDFIVGDLNELIDLLKESGLFDT